MFWIALERILLTIWVGAIWTVGFFVVPTLFTVMENRHAAGDVAARLFSHLNIIGLIAGGILLIVWLFKTATPWQRNAGIWILVAMLAITLIMEFVVAPQLMQLRLVAGDELVSDTPLRQSFAKLHVTSSVLFSINGVLGLILVVRPVLRN